MNKIGKTSVYVGILLFVVLSASVYILSQDNGVRIDVKNTYTEFSVFDNHTGSWILGGEERTVLFDGSAKMRASSREVNYTIDNETNITTIYRYAYFKNNIIVIDKYVFDGNEEAVELFPISHEITVLNAKTAQEELGKTTNFILDYEVSKLLYFGETNSDLGTAHEFGNNMKVEWQDTNYYGKVYKYANKDEGKLNIKYRVSSDNFTISARLFDPIIDKDIVFKELISLKSEFSYGEAIFEFNNPVDNLSLQDLYITMNILEGGGISSIDYYVKETEEIKVPQYKEEKVEVKCDTNSTNFTELNGTKEKCYEYNQIEDGFKIDYKESWKKVDYLDKGSYEVKMVVNYKEPGQNVFEWFPNLDLDKNKYELPLDKYGKRESKQLVQDKW